MKQLTVLFVASLAVLTTAQAQVAQGMAAAFQSVLGRWEYAHVPGACEAGPKPGVCKLVQVPSGPRSTLAFFGMPMLVGKSDSGLQYMMMGVQHVTASVEPSEIPSKLEIVNEEVKGKHTVQSFVFRAPGRSISGQVRFETSNARQAFQAKVLMHGLAR